MCEGSDDRKRLLSEHYPGLYISILRHMDKQKDLQDYQDYCEKLRDDHQRYSLYCHGYLIPKLQELRKQGRLKQGSRNVRDEMNRWIKYQGEVDEEGKACGEGVARYDNG